MNFLQRNNFRPSFRRQAGGQGKRAGLLVLIFVALAIFFSRFGGEVVDGLAPLWQSDTAINRGAQSALSLLRSKDELARENSDLRERLAASEELIISLRAISASRDELLAAFGREPTSGIPASALIHPPQTPYDVLILDAGENWGVRTGQLVTLPGGSLIGSVVESFARTARVRLYSTAGLRTEAVLERGSVPVTLIGRGGGNLSFVLPRDIPVMVGDRILSATLDSSLVAVVGEIEAEPTDSFKTVLVQSPTDPTTIRFVVIKP